MMQPYQDQHLSHAVVTKTDVDGGTGDHSERDDEAPTFEPRRNQQRDLTLTRHTSAFDDASLYHPSKRVRFYSPPQQRQRWGETQILPRVNWGDLFFDLFFVAASYQVSIIVGEDPSLLGVLFAAGTFLPVMGMWLQKMWYDSRYVHEEDLFHRLLELAELVLLATSVLHIRSVTIMSNISEQVSMFAFALSLVLERILAALRYSEVYFLGVGDCKGMKGSVRLMLMPVSIMICCYLSAAVIAGIAYYGSGVSNRRLGEDTPATKENAELQFTPSYVPIWLCFAGYVVYLLAITIQVQFFFPSGGRHKEMSVPMNVDFTIHRNGEWIMLMLGECIVSLLTVDAPIENTGFYTTFFCGVLTVILLQYLHFRSQPDADGHAMRRHKNAGIWWSNLQYVYSFFLVCLGASFTFFLRDSSIGYNRNLDGRFLAGSESAYDPEELRSSAANFFGASLSIIFFCLDAMTLLHLGINESHSRCVCEKTKKKNVKGLFLIFLRLMMIAFTATLGLWLIDPPTLSVLGVILVLIQILFRKLGCKYLTRGQVHALDAEDSERSEEEASWPNVTHARAEPAVASASDSP